MTDHDWKKQKGIENKRKKLVENVQHPLFTAVHDLFHDSNIFNLP